MLDRKDSFCHKYCNSVEFPIGYDQVEKLWRVDNISDSMNFCLFSPQHTLQTPNKHSSSFAHAVNTTKLIRQAPLPYPP